MTTPSDKALKNVYIVLRTHRIFGAVDAVAAFAKRSHANKFCDEKHANPRVPESHCFVVVRAPFKELAP